MLADLLRVGAQKKSTQTKAADRRTDTSTEGETERRQDTTADFLSLRSSGGTLYLVPALSNQLASHMAGLYL